MTDASNTTVLLTKDVTRPRTFALAPDADTRSALAEELGISGIRKLTFSGEVAPEGQGDLLLAARLGATVVQPCVVTLAPVTTRIDEDVTRRFLLRMPEPPEGEEIEMPEDDTIEPLGRMIDLHAVMAEALALALPSWPRAEGVDPVEVSVTEPGQEALTDDDVKPFAGLKSLRDRLEDPDPKDD